MNELNSKPNKMNQQNKTPSKLLKQHNVMEKTFFLKQFLIQASLVGSFYFVHHLVRPFCSGSSAWSHHSFKTANCSENILEGKQKWKSKYLGKTNLLFSLTFMQVKILGSLFFFSKPAQKTQIHYSRSGGRIERIFHNNFFPLTLYFLEGFDVLSLMSSVTTLFYMGGLCKSITWWKQP